MDYLKTALLFLLCVTFSFASYYEDFSTLGIGTTLANGSQGIEYGCWAVGADTGCFDSISTAPIITFYNGKNHLNMTTAFGLKIPYAITNVSTLEIGLVIERAASSSYSLIGFQNGTFYPSGPVAKLPVGNGYGTWFENGASATGTPLMYVFRNNTGFPTGSAPTETGIATNLSVGHWILKFTRNLTNVSMYVNNTLVVSAINDTYIAAGSIPYAIIYTHNSDARWLIDYISISETVSNASLTINASVMSALTNTDSSTFLGGEPMIPLLTLSSSQNTASANITADVTFNLTGLTYPLTLSSGNGTLYNFAGSNITFLTNVSRQANLSFRLYFLNATDNVTLNSTVLFTLSFLNISNCSSGFPILNFSFYSQETPTIPLLSDMSATFELNYLGIRQNLSLNVSSVYNFSVCTNLNLNNLTVSSTQAFTGSNGSYRTLYYYLVHASVTPGTTQPISLYSVLTAPTVATKITVLTGNSQAVPGAYVRAVRNYPATNQFLTASMLRTDNNGIGSTYLVPLTTIYRFVVIDSDGTITYTSDTSTLTCDPSATLCEKTILIDEGVENPYSAYIGNIGVACTFTNTSTSGTITCISDNPSGTATELSLNVYEVQAFSNVLVCTNSVSSGSGTVICPNLNNTKTYYYRAIATMNGGEVVLGSGYIRATKLTSSFGDSGLFFGMLMVLALGMVGVYAGAMGVLMGTAFGFGLSTLLGFFPFAVGTVSSVFMFAIIVGWMMFGRRS